MKAIITYRTYKRKQYDKNKMLSKCLKTWRQSAKWSASKKRAHQNFPEAASMLTIKEQNNLLSPCYMKYIENDNVDIRKLVVEQ